MIIILAVASLSLGFSLDFGKIDSAIHENTTAHLSPQFSESEPLTTKSQQFISLQKDTAKLQSTKTRQKLQKPTNDECSLTVGDGGDYNSVVGALAFECEDNYYDISLKYSIHIENLIIDQDSTIHIQGTDIEEHNTQWNSNPTDQSLYTIELKKGRLNILFVDFQFVTASGSFAYPTQGIIYIHSENDPYPYFTISNCNFRGLGNEQGSPLINSMIRIDGADTVIFEECSFCSAISTFALIRAVDYSTLEVRYSNFTDINGVGETGAIEVSAGKSNDWTIAISGNYFDNCVGAKYGAICVQTGSAARGRLLSIGSNQIENCAGGVTGGIHVNYADFRDLYLSMNTFIDNRITDSQGQFGCDAHIYKQSIIGVSDPVQYYKEKFEDGKSNNPKSIFIEIGDSDSGYFSLNSVSNKCWDASIEPEYFEGCICTAQGHPTECACPDDDPNYQQDKCDFYLLPVCSSGSNPDQCRCSTSNYSLNCLCPLDDLDTTYTQTLCLDEKEYAQLPPCISDTATPQEGCKCTIDNHPANCVCPLNNDGLYTKDKCLLDILHRCTTDATPASGCKCTLDNHPTDCTCPTDDPDYISTKCQEDKQPVTPDKCASVTSTTPEVDCACPTDPTQLELDPRKDTICKPSTGKEASGSVRAVLNLIVAVVLIPSLALIF